jgi:hypothetical protein
MKRIWAVLTVMVASPSFACGAMIIESTNSPAGWLATGAAPSAGWESNLGFDDSSWVPASDVNGIFTSTYNGLPWNFIWWNNTQSTPQEGWFRYEFMLTDTLINPVFHSFLDDDGEVYFNGHLLFDDKSSAADNALTDFDISLYLNVGQNLIAFHVIDYGGNRFGGVRLDADAVISGGAVPEPGALSLWAAACGILAGVRRFRAMAKANVA